MPVYQDEGRRLRTLANDHRTLVYYTKHAEIRMHERNISRLAIERVLKAGCVVSVEMGSDEKWTVQGHDYDGRRIEAVVVPNEGELEIVIVTALTD